MDSTKALDDKAIDAAIREWMASDDMSADGFRLRMRAAIAAALAQGEAAQPAAETPFERQRRLCDRSISRAEGYAYCCTCGQPTSPNAASQDGGAGTMNVILTVADHEKNGLVALAQWPGLSEAEARAFIEANDAAVDDDAEPDIATAAFTFILDLMDDANGDLIDTGKRQLPTQLAMSLAPDQVRQWLEERPDPDSVMYRAVPNIGAAS